MASAGFAITSCNKDYSCYCHEPLNNKDTVLTWTVREKSARTAKQVCENLSDTYSKCALNK